MIYYYIPKGTAYGRAKANEMWEEGITARDVVYYLDNECLAKTSRAYYFRLPKEAAPWEVVTFKLKDVTECEGREELEQAQAADWSQARK